MPDEHVPDERVPDDRSGGHRCARQSCPRRRRIGGGNDRWSITSLGVLRSDGQMTKVLINDHIPTVTD
ncbi:hypothetical protein GCM10009780_23200 [Actinomadura alba]